MPDGTRRAGGSRSSLPRRPAGDGLRVRPFRAVRYTDPAHPDLAPVIAPPYDVIDEAERVELEGRDPHNVVRLILPREPVTAGVDRYLAAASLYRAWLDDGVLEPDRNPGLYFYEQSRSGAVLQAGLFVAVGLEPLDSGVIFPHEAVRQGPVADRLALMRAMQANPEPILLVYDGGGVTSAVCAEVAAAAPLRSTTTDDGVRHRLWAISEPDSVKSIQADLSTYSAMIADGHHRYTTYRYLRDEQQAQRDADGKPSDAWDFGLALLVDLSVASPEVKAIHRVVPGLTVTDAARLAQAGFAVVRDLGIDSTDLANTAGVTSQLLTELERTKGHAFVITNGRRHVLLSDPDAAQLALAKPADRSDAWWALDASVAGAYLLAQLWETDDVEGVLEAEHDPIAAVRIAGELDGVALLLKPPPLDGIIAVAVAGDTMPRKSTLFGPKPRSGVVLRSLRDDL